jgi:hypothetical protein
MFVASYPASFLREKTGGFHARFPICKRRSPAGTI